MNTLLFFLPIVVMILLVFVLTRVLQRLEGRSRAIVTIVLGLAALLPLLYAEPSLYRIFSLILGTWIILSGFRDLFQEE